jgi:hypothetical protein
MYLLSKYTLTCVINIKIAAWQNSATRTRHTMRARYKAYGINLESTQAGSIVNSVTRTKGANEDAQTQPEATLPQFANSSLTTGPLDL